MLFLAFLLLALRSLFFRCLMTSASGSSNDQEPGPSEVKEEPSSKAPRLNDDLPVPKCDDHPLADCLFWCGRCKMAMCMECANDKHQDHKLRLLQFIIKDKVSEAMERFDYLQENIQKVDDNISHCDDEISYHTNNLESAKNSKESCELIKDFSLSFGRHRSDLERFVDQNTIMKRQ